MTLEGELGIVSGLRLCGDIRRTFSHATQRQGRFTQGIIVLWVPLQPLASPLFPG